MGKWIHNENFVWQMLIIITLLTWYLIEGTHTDLAIYTIILFSSFKVYTIGLAYMEVLKANTAFMHFFHIWVIAVTVMMMSFKSFYF